MADLLRARQVLEGMPSEPIGEWMRARGCPPEEWVLVLPDSMRDKVEAPALLPSYVQFSSVPTAQVFLARRFG